MHPTLAFLKKRIKIRVCKVWRRTVKKSSPGTTFINHYYPNPNPSSIFLGTPREIYSKVSQTLSGHGYTREYFTKMKIPESPWCLCSTSIGAPVYNTCLHILRECQRYSSSRHLLTDDIPDLHDPNWKIKNLGEPKKALLALISFLDKSGAFTKLGVPFHLNPILPPERPKKPPFYFLCQLFIVSLVC